MLFLAGIPPPPPPSLLSHLGVGSAAGRGVEVEILFLLLQQRHHHPKRGIFCEELFRTISLPGS